MTLRIAAVALLTLCAAPLGAQRTLQDDRSVVSQVRIDMRDLGYPPADVIPAGESAVRALAVAPNGAIYGITSGKRSHIFALFPQHGYVQPLGYLKGVTSVGRSLVISANGDVYIGAAGPGGRLYRYTPKRDEEKPIRVDEECGAADLGAPVPEGGIHALAINRLSDVIYGVAAPGGEFFSYDVAKARFTVHGKVAEGNIPGERFERHKNLGRAIVLDGEGRVYVSGEDGAIFRFDFTRQTLEKLSVAAPTVLGREPYNGVDAWVRAESGDLYGGTSDGYLFRFDPKSATMENLGKPLNQYRIRGLAFARNGKLYGVGGDDDEMARLFSYEPARGTYEMLGMIDVNRRPYYSWHAYVIDGMAIGKDDTIYLGQSERKSKLYLYHPEPLLPRE